MSEASCVVCAGGVGTVCNDVWKEKKIQRYTTKRTEVLLKCSSCLEVVVR